MRDEDFPSIGITCGTDKIVPKGRDLYARAVESAQGRAAFLSPTADVGESARTYDGFIIPGGRDIHPSFYNEALAMETVPEEEGRTAFELYLIRAIIDTGKPILGICYGMQLINIFFGGDLYQDCLLQMPGCDDHRGGSHIVSVSDNPFAAACECVVNSSHHQAVRRVGTGLRPFASAPDGVIEAIYREGHPFLVGVQWHPERMNGPLTAALFARFVQECRAKR